jgi:hypothetical protein
MIRRASGLLILLATLAATACSTPTAPEPVAESCSPVYGQSGTRC